MKFIGTKGTRLKQLQERGVTFIIRVSKAAYKKTIDAGGFINYTPSPVRLFCLESRSRLRRRRRRRCRCRCRSSVATPSQSTQFNVSSNPWKSKYRSRDIIPAWGYNSYYVVTVGTGFSGKGSGNLPLMMENRGRRTMERDFPLKVAASVQ